MSGHDQVSLRDLEGTRMVTLLKLSVVLLVDVILNDVVTYVEVMTLYILFSLPCVT